MENNSIIKKTYINQHIFANVPLINKDQLEKILLQTENNICKIIQKNGKMVTGFFSKIPFPDQFHLLPALIIFKNNLKLNGEIEILFNNNKKRTLNLNEKRIIYPCKNSDVIIIEIKPEIDGIKYFLDIDDNVFNDNYKEIYKKNMQIYIISSSGNSIGKLINIENEKKNLIHDCGDFFGSPILCLFTFRLIGINLKKNEHFKYNEGIFIKYVIEELNQAFHKSIISKINISNNKLDINIPSNHKYIKHNNLNYNPMINKSKSSEINYNYNNMNSNFFYNLR